MKCEELEEALPDLLEGGASAAAKQHLRSCPACSELLQDLKTISAQARLLGGSEEPHPRVWAAIQEVVEREGLAREVADPPHRWLVVPVAWATPARLAAASCLLLLAGGVALYRNIGVPVGPGAPQPTAMVFTAAAPPMDANDQKILAAVQDREAAVRDRYERNLKNVNAYIRDAKRNVEVNPDDEDARDTLRQAYEQKALLYEMAVSRSME